LGPEYLLLLGGPFAAAALASASTASKAAAKQIQPVQAAKPAAADLVTSTTGDPSLSDAQFLLFNLVALGWFTVALIRAPSQLPDLPATLVGLTSVSALGYLGAKVASTNPPVITSVVITSQPSNGLLHAGDTVRITGSGFHPAQGRKKDSGVLVLFNGVQAKVAKPSDTALVATVPPGLVPTAGPHLSIEVQTSADVVTPDPFTSLSLEGPRITSVSRTGGTIDVRGYGLSASPQPAVTVTDQAGEPAVLSGRPGPIPADGQDPDGGQLAQDGQPAQHREPGLRIRIGPPAQRAPYKVTVTVSGASSSMNAP
jgi:hypothetical protein